MKSTMNKSFQVLAVASVFLLSAVGVSAQTTGGAYSGPTGAPPTNNVAAPINVGSGSQTKTGLLRVNGGFYNAGTSVFERRVEIGIDPCYGVSSCSVPTGGGSPSASAPNSFIERLASAIVPKTASAVGTPTTDILHVYGNASFTGGAVTINGKNVCLSDGTNCGTGSAQWTAGVGTGSANIFRPTGRVSVGLTNTTTPVAKFEIRDTDAQLAIGQSATNRWKLWGGSNLHFRNNADTDIFYLGGDGKVGVGTTAPSAKFTVAGDGKIGNVELVDNQGGSLELGAGGSATTPYIDFRGNGSAGADYNARIINNANGQLSFQTVGGEKMKVVNTSQSVIVTNSPAVYLVTSGSCNGFGPSASGPWTFLGSGTLQRGTLTTYSHCQISGSGVAQELVGYLLPPPPAATGGGSSSPLAISTVSIIGGNCSSCSGSRFSDVGAYVSKGGEVVNVLGATITINQGGAVSTYSSPAVIEAGGGGYPSGTKLVRAQHTFACGATNSYSVSITVNTNHGTVTAPTYTRAGFSCI